MVWEGACSTCSPVPAHVLVSNIILGSGSGPLPEGLLLARIGGPYPTFLPEQLLKIFKARRRKTTDFLHFGNLLSRCGEDGSGVSKASSAAAPPDAEASADETRRSCWTWLFGGGFGCRRMLGTRWPGWCRPQCVGAIDLGCASSERALGLCLGVAKSPKRWGSAWSSIQPDKGIFNHP